MTLSMYSVDTNVEVLIFVVLECVLCSILFEMFVFFTIKVFKIKQEKLVDRVCCFVTYSVYVAGESHADLSIHKFLKKQYLRKRLKVFLTFKTTCCYTV